MKLSHITFLAAVGVLTPLAIGGGPGTVTPLFTNIATSTTSDVPGLGGTKFTSGTSTTVFDRPYVSPDGLHYVIRGDAALTSSADSVIIYDGTLLAQESAAAPFAVGQNWGPPDIRLGINDLGEVAISVNVQPATTADDYVVKFSPAGPTWSILAQDTMSIAALPTSNYANAIDSIGLLADGTPWFRADVVTGGGIPTANDELLLLGSTIVAQEGLTIPAGQLNGPTAWENFAIDGYFVSPDGLNVLIDGDLLVTPTTADQVTTYNGTVVIQESFPIPGTAFTSPVVAGGADFVSLDPAGRWFARGNNADTQDWVVRNGVVLAKTDDPIGATTNTFDGAANGAQVVPPSGSTATAVADFFVDTVQNKLWYDVVLTGVTGETAANISGFAGAGVNGAPLYTLPIGTPKRGFVVYPEIDEANILAGQTYLEILTTALPTGAIRGQIVPEVETWDDADNADGFFAATGNAAGDYLVMGLTSGPFNVNGVVLLNGNTVVLREGDPIDVDSNGLFDDNAFIQSFGNDDFQLTPDGSIYFFCTVRDGAQVEYATGIFRRAGNGGSFAFCTNGSLGVDHTTACPCGNTGAPGNGCGHSFDPNGANLEATGTPSLDDVVLHSQFEPVSSFTLFMQHANAGDSVFHDGVLCAANPLIRLRGRAAVAGEAFFPNSNFAQDSTTTLSIRGGTFPGSGATMRYAAWYRNASSTFCPPATANVTNGWQITW